MIRSRGEAPLRIGITTNTLDAGGAEVQRVLLANELHRIGHSVDIICLQHEGVLGARIHKAVAVVRASWYEPKRRIYDALIVGTTNTEVAHGLLNSLGRRTRLIVAIHNPVGEGAPPVSPLVRAVASIASARIALSVWHARGARRQLGMNPSHIVSNAPESDHSSDVRRARELTDEYEYEVGFLGRLSVEHKGLDRLLYAVSADETGTLKLAIGGVGADGEHARNLAARLGIGHRVRFLGHVDPSDFFRRVAVIAMFSRYEGQPMVALEAMEAGVPIVATNGAGLSPAAGVSVLQAFEPRAAASALLEAVARRREAPAATGRSVTDMAHEYLKIVRG